MLAASDVVHVLIDRPLKVAIVIAVAFVANWLVHRAINRFVRRIQGEPAREALNAMVDGQTPTDTQPLRLRRDTDLGPRIMDEPQVWGVERIGDGAIAIRLVVRASPRARWRVERELRARVKQALQKHNVPLKAVS